MMFGLHRTGSPSVLNRIGSDRIGFGFGFLQELDKEAD